MAENPNQPASDDAVLGGQNPQPINAAVLGSIEGVKRRLASGDVAQRIAALPEALKYGQDGLELLMHGLNDESWQVQCAAYSLLQENVEPALKSSLRAYNPYLLKCLHSLTGELGSRVKSVAISPDGQTLVGSMYVTIKLWNLRTGELKSTLTGHSQAILSVAFSPDGRTLGSGSYDKTIKLWDVGTDELRSTLTGHSDTVNSVAFSPDGQSLASGSDDRTIKLWNTNIGELRSTLTGHSNKVKSVAFSPDGKTLASGSDDHTIKLWDVGSGELKSTLEGHSGYFGSVAFSPDGLTLASGSWDKTIKLWDVGTGKLKRTLKHSRYVESITFSPDGQTLASGSYDKTIKLWDVGTGELRSTLTGHSNTVTSVTFSPDGQTIVSGSDDTTLKLWGRENSSQPRPDSVQFFHRYLALKKALKSGQAGLDLLIQALKDESWSVREAAYSLLQESEEPRVKQALQEYGSDSSFAVGMNYARLKSLLVAQRWKEAEEETENIMLDISGCERGADVSSILDLRTIPSTLYGVSNDSDLQCRIPDQDLRTIYDLWERYSNGRSSFNEQKSSLGFWIDCKDQIPEFFSSRDRIRKQFAEEQRDLNVHGGYSHWD
jgi:WD40 repeat protein